MKGLTEIIEEQTGKKYRTPEDIARFALEDARRKEEPLRHVQLMCVAQCIMAGVILADIGASEKEKEEIEEIIKQQG